MAINQTNKQLLLAGANTELAKNVAIYSVSKTFGVSNCGICLPLLIKDFLIVDLFNCTGINSLTEEEQEELLLKASNNVHITFVEDDCEEGIATDETFFIAHSSDSDILINGSGDKLLWLKT